MLSSIIPLSNYPEEVLGNIKIYGEKSEDARMAVMTHFLHNSSLYDSMTYEERDSLVEIINDYLEHKVILKLFEESDVNKAC